MPGTETPGSTTVEDSGWGEWINRINAALRWGRWTAGLRLDSALYWRRPADNATLRDAAIRRTTQQHPRPGQRVALSQLDLPREALDDVRGARPRGHRRRLVRAVRARPDPLDAQDRRARDRHHACAAPRSRSTRDPFAVTVVAGFANPSRVDEATGRALFVTSNLASGDVRQPLFGSDRLVGVDLQAGRGLPVTLSTHVVRFTRCAPYHYNGANIDTDFASDPGDGDVRHVQRDRHEHLARTRSTARRAASARTTSRWPGSRSRCPASAATESSTSRRPCSSALTTSPGRRRTSTATRSTPRSRSTRASRTRRSR